VPLAFLAVSLIWGSTFLGIRVAIATIPPLLMAGFRNVAAGAILYGAARAFGAAKPEPRMWWPALLTGGLMLGVGNGGISWAELEVPSGLAALFPAAIPAWMVALEAARPGAARPSRRVLLGLVLGFLGIAAMVGPGLRPVAPGLLTAVVLLLAPLCWAAGSVLAPRSKLPHSLAVTAAMQMLAGGAGLVVVGFAAGEGPRLSLAAVSSASAAGFLWLVLAGSVVGFSAYAYLLRHASPSRVGAYAFLNPVVALFLGWALAGEQLTWVSLAAGALVVAGAALVTLRPRPAARPANLRLPADGEAPAGAVDAPPAGALEAPPADALPSPRAPATPDV